MDADSNRLLEDKFQALIEDHWLKPIRKGVEDPTDQWHLIMGKLGLRCPTWPENLGGLDYTHDDAAVWWNACASNDCPFPDPVATELVGPLLQLTRERGLYEDRLVNIALGYDHWQVVLLRAGDAEIRTITTETNPNRILLIEVNQSGQATFSLSRPWQGIEHAQQPGADHNLHRETLDLDLPRALEVLARDHQPLSAIWRNRSLLRTILMDVSASDSDWAHHELAQLNIEQSALETLCLRLIQNKSIQKLSVVTLRARKIRAEAQGLQRRLAGYYAITEAAQPGANRSNPVKGLPGDAMTIIDEFLQPDFAFRLITEATAKPAEPLST